MQKHKNAKRARVAKKDNFQSSAQIGKRFERSLALMHDNSPLSNIACKIGDNTCAAKHLTVSRRTGLLQAKNGNRRAHAFLRLQQQYGNRFVDRIISQHAVQTKLKIREPGDRYEQEANFVADKVMGMPEPPVEGRGGGEEEQEGLFLQKKMSDTPSKATPSFGQRLIIPKEGGEPLPASEKAFFAARFIQQRQGKVEPSAPAKKLSGNNITNNISRQTNRTIQRLTVTRHSLHKGDCGERRVRWKFSLNNAAPSDGYIVQQVDKYEFLRGCPSAAGPPAPDGTFWEAWFVRSGAKNEHMHGSFGFTDQSSRPAERANSGEQTSDGTIKFFTKAVTGDLGKDGVVPSNPKSPWGPGNVPASGALPSTSSRPSWWNNAPTEGPVTRSASSVWDCCGADKSKHYSTITARP